MTDNHMLTAILHLEAAARSMECCPDDARAIIQFLHDERDAIIQRRLAGFVAASASRGRNH